MKKGLLIFALLGLGSLANYLSARDIIPVNWASIEAIATTKPDSVKSLVKRLSAPELDKTLTWEERILAVYGQSILSESSEESLADKAVDAYNQENYKAAITFAKNALNINPMNVSALHICKNSIAALVKSGDTTYTMDEGQVFHNREMRIYNTIATTGDGSADYPFYTTCVSEEYYFMRHYLDLWEYSEQALEGQCDRFTLKETSEYYSDKVIYFDTSRALMIEHKEFMKK